MLHEAGVTDSNNPLSCTAMLPTGTPATETLILALSVVVPVFGAAIAVTVPSPVPEPGLTVSQLVLVDTAVQPIPGAVIVIPVPLTPVPVEPMLTGVGVAETTAMLV